MPHAKTILGMIHLPPLPGSPRFDADLKTIRARAIADAKMLVAAGFDGLILENFGDAPFFPGRVPAHVVACITAVAAAVRDATDLPMGINVLRNDGRSALAVALAVGAQFIRVNILCGARVTDQGVIEGVAHDLQRDRAQLGAGHIRVFADVDVKHSAPLGERRAMEDEVDDTIHRGMADAVIVSGAGTGKPTDLKQVQRVKAAAKATPVFIGSGVTAATVGRFLRVADGVIVGSALKVDGAATNRVDAKRAVAFMKAARLGGLTLARR
jgi:membrane complex biogenesis BtpA family protein